MKRLTVLLLAFVLLLSACSESKSFTVNVASAGESMVKATKYEAGKLSEEDVYNLTGISSEMYTASYFAYLLESSIGNCACIAVFEAKDETSLNTVKAKLETFLKDEQEKQKTYSPDVNYPMTQNAEIKTEGLYIYLSISPDNTVVAAAFENAKTFE